MLKYLRYFLFWPVSGLTMTGLLVGGAWTWLGFLATASFLIIGDELLPEERQRRSYSHPWILNLALFSTLPLIILAQLAFILSIPGNSLTPFLGITPATGYSPIAWLGASASVGLMIAIGGETVAHELYHRLSSRPALLTARLLLAFSYDAPLRYSHLYGHHRNTGLESDHTTARRGENVYQFIWRSTIGGNTTSWRREANRLARDNLNAFSWRNNVLHDYLLSLSATMVFYLLAGWQGVLISLSTAVISKALLESVNYIQHYGLVREPGTRVAHRHSWDTNKLLSTCLLWNVTRHAYHHAHPNDPYWKLTSVDDSPKLRFGYMTTITLAFLPPLWHLHMGSQLERWDKQFATAGERAITLQANGSR